MGLLIDESIPYYVSNALSVHRVSSRLELSQVNEHQTIQLPWYTNDHGTTITPITPTEQK